MSDYNSDQNYEDTQVAPNDNGQDDDDAIDGNTDDTSSEDNS